MNVQDFSKLVVNKLYETHEPDWNLLMESFEIIRLYRNSIFLGVQFSLIQTLNEAVRNYTSNTYDRKQPSTTKEFHIILIDALSQIDVEKFKTFIDNKY